MRAKIGDSGDSPPGTGSPGLSARRAALCRPARAAVASRHRGSRTRAQRPDDFTGTSDRAALGLRCASSRRPAAGGAAMNQRGLLKADYELWLRENGLDDDRSTGDDMNDRNDFGRDDSNGGGEDARARDHGPAGVSIDDFLAYMPQRSSYFFTPSRELWPGTGVDARLPPVVGPNGKPIKPSAWLAANAAVEQTTWAPGEPMLIKDRLVSDGGWIKRPGCHIFNLYRPPALVPQAGEVGPWLDLVHRGFPDQADHIILWVAHRVQRPHEKINHALVLGGKPGIGKDTILEPIKQAVGPWNFADVSPHRILGNFNSHARSVILRISEARDLGDWDRFAFYDRMKGLIAAPPDVVQVNEKHLREYYILNLCGVVITSNHKTDGIYLPAEDRRHFVAWSSLSNTDFADDYWRKQYRWYARGGNEAVAEYLASRDLSGFDPKAPPPKTGAFWEIVNANRAPEDAELQDVLDDLERPDILTIDRVASQASVLHPAFAEWLRDAKANARRIPHRFEDCGDVVVRNPNDSEGRWKIKGRRHTIYGKASLTERDRLAAAFELAGAR